MLYFILGYISGMVSFIIIAKHYMKKISQEMQEHYK